MGDIRTERGDLVHIATVEAIQDYKLVVGFSDGTKRLYDATSILERPYYAPLKDSDFFNTAHIEGCSVAWNNGIDIAPELLYEKSVPIA